MGSVEGSRPVPSGVGYGEGCPLFSRLGCLGKRHELPSGVRDTGLAKNGFWRILKATERPFCTYMTKSEGKQFALVSPLLQILPGGLIPRSSVIYAPGCTPVMFSEVDEMFE